MLTIGSDELPYMFVKDMGIKTTAVGDEIIYTRPGGYFYIELSTEEKEG